jgi:hypothetical protein
VLLGIEDYPNLKHVWIESCRKVRKQDKYNLVLRTEESLNGDDVDAAEKALGGDAGVLSSGYEAGCDCCICGGGGSSYIEFEIDGCTIPTLVS